MWLWLTACSLLDRTPPDIQVVGPDTPVRQEAAFRISTNDLAAGMHRLMVVVDEDRMQLLPTERANLDWVLGVGALSDGIHKVAFSATDGSWMGNVSSVELQITVDRAPPEVEVAPIQGHQGRTMVVWIRGNERLGSGAMAFAGRTLPLFPVGGALRGLAGIAPDHPPGEHQISIVARDLAGNIASTRAVATVLSSDFDREPMTLVRPRGVGDASEQQMRTERSALASNDGREQRWDGPMGLPVAYGKLTKPYGYAQFFRDGGANYHLGMDLSKRRGARISAAAAGLVVLAKAQPVYGNVVILDHGQGVLTTYNHLQQVRVAKGDTVTKGQEIGTMGATGKVTSTHLHWGLLVGRVNVNPDQWLSEDFSRPTFENR